MPITAHQTPDWTGQTIDFCSQPKRNAGAAERFVVRAIEASGNAVSWDSIASAMPHAGWVL